MKALDNPYANVDRDMAADDAAASQRKRSSRRLASARNDRGQLDFFSIADGVLPRESFGSGNPYANVASEGETLGAELPQRAPSTTITKQEFREASTAILGRYSPLSLRGRLRPHHRDFIARNEAKSPTVRHQVLDALRQFDLSQIRGLETYLHREDDALSEAMLKAIEDSIDDAE